MINNALQDVITLLLFAIATILGIYIGFFLRDE